MHKINCLLSNMGCAPTARKRSIAPVGKDDEANATTSALTSKIIKDISSGKMSKATYDKMLKMDIKIN